jgi:two-component system OmpR family response regulator
VRAFGAHGGVGLDRARLHEIVLGRAAHVSGRGLDNQVSRLRRKIEVDSRNPQMIQTVWGGGYMLAADVRRVPGEPA